MSAIYVAGVGAVSPAGWGLAALRAAVEAGEPLPVQSLERPGLSGRLDVRPVPDPATRPAFMTHPRARRSSPVTQYAAASALAAVEQIPAEARAALGVIFCLQSGPVRYASRFFQEMEVDPATASPLLFPETVFSAPASHVAAVLGNVPIAYTLLGDPGALLHGLALAANWLDEGRCELCMVIGGEEFNWLHVEAVRHFDEDSVTSAGAGAICLTSNPRLSAGVALECVTDAHTYSRRLRQPQAIQSMRRQLPGGAPDELLYDSQGGCLQADKAEQAAWANWPGQRVSPKGVLGEGLMAGAGWQLVLAADAVARGIAPAANVSVVGCHQQAIGARFCRA